MKEYFKQNKAVSVLLLLGAVLVLYRLFWGLGAVSALSDSQPWGLIKALNILSGGALAAGSFVVAASVHIFGIKRLKPIVRPALLMGAIGHTFVLASLLYDVGRPILVWRILIDPNLNSIMLYTFACEAIYTTAVICEIMPEFVKSKKYEAIVDFMSSIKGGVFIVSAAVSVVYQSNLGALYLVSPHRISALWYSPWLPTLFFFSAVSSGLGMVAVENGIAAVSGSRVWNKDAMSLAGSIMAASLCIFLALRVVDLAMRDGFQAMTGHGFQAAWFIAEMACFAAALIMSLIPAVRESASGLLKAGALAAAGVVLNRLGVAVVGWENFAGVTYIPNLMELYASFVLILAPVVLYKYFSASLLTQGGQKAA